MIKQKKPKPDGMIFLISIGISLILVWFMGYYKSWKFIFSFLGEEATLAAFLVNTLIWGIFVYAIIMLLLGKIKLSDLIKK